MIAETKRTRVMTGCSRATDAPTSCSRAQLNLRKHPHQPCALWSPPTTARHLNMASTNAQERLLDAAFEDFATSLVVSNIYYLFPANTIGFSHSIPALKSQFASDLHATNISSRKPSSASSPHISQLCLKDPLGKGKSRQQLWKR
jgi:hypothetical protein